MTLSEALLVLILGAGIGYATYCYWMVVIKRKSKSSFKNVSSKKN